MRELTVSTYPELKYFNIPTLLEETYALRTLRVESPAPRVVKVTTKEGVDSYQLVQDAASDLQTELYGPLPRKLKYFIISGAGFDRLADGIFEVNILYFKSILNIALFVISGSSIFFVENIYYQHNFEWPSKINISKSWRSL